MQAVSDRGDLREILPFDMGMQPRRHLCPRLHPGHDGTLDPNHLYCDRAGQQERQRRDIGRSRQATRASTSPYQNIPHHPGNRHQRVRHYVGLLSGRSDLPAGQFRQNCYGRLVQILSSNRGEIETQ